MEGYSLWLSLIKRGAFTYHNATILKCQHTLYEEQTYYQIEAVHVLAAGVESFYFSFINCLHNRVSCYLFYVSNKKKVTWMVCRNHKMKELFPFDMLSPVFRLHSDLLCWHLIMCSGSFNLNNCKQFVFAALIISNFTSSQIQYTFSEEKSGTGSSYAFLKTAETLSPTCRSLSWSLWWLGKAQCSTVRFLHWAWLTGFCVGTWRTWARRARKFSS